MNYKLTIGWLYPELMSTYGDRGNIIVLTKRCEWRKIGINVIPIDFSTSLAEVKKCDFIFGGGAQDRQQSLVISDLRKNKGPELKKMIDNGIPGLFVCGAPQLLGHFYMTGEDTKLEGLGIFDMESRHFGKNKPRCIGNLVAEINSEFRMEYAEFRNTVVGFENHGGRTYLGKNVKPFAKVLFGRGNNGEDSTEGAIFKNCIATYSHGPFLPKNPHIADWLIFKALEVKYHQKINLKQLKDNLEWQAHDFMVNKFTSKR
jgi:lipid II isoglutaminyl synthase (glutamine-hydrolysing)